MPGGQRRCASGRSPDHRRPRAVRSGRASSRSGSRRRPAAPASRRRPAPAGTARGPGTVSGRLGARHRDPGLRRDAGRCAPPSRGRRRAAAGPSTEASSGAAACRSRSSRSSWCRHSCDSASRTAVSTSAMIAGCSVIAGPLTSTMPSSSPVRGSWIGAAVQYQGCWSASKCSAENSCTGLASASAVPIALVPTRSSVHSRALREAEPVGAAAHPGGALAPQDDAVGVGDHHQELRGVGDRGDDRAQLVDHQRHRRARGAAPAPGPTAAGRAGCGRRGRARRPAPGTTTGPPAAAAAAAGGRRRSRRRASGPARGRSRGRSVPGRIALKSPTRRA